MLVPPERVTYVDRTELVELFADSIGAASLNGDIALLTFCVTRPDETRADEPATAKRYPVARIAITPEALVSLASFVNGCLTVLEKQGKVKREPRSLSKSALLG
jgi:hypothetical protein